MDKFKTGLVYTPEKCEFFWAQNISPEEKKSTFRADLFMKKKRNRITHTM